MAFATVNGIRLSYDDTGTGEPVVLVMGAGGRGRAWHLHQVPALCEQGYRVITYDSRGVPPSDPGTAGFTVDDLVTDLVRLIEELGVGPCRMVGTSLGALVVQELMLVRPDLVRQAVLMATRGRGDHLRDATARAEVELLDAGVTLPPRYAAAMQALQNLSPYTLNNDMEAADWLSIFEVSPPSGIGFRHQLAIVPGPDRLAAYTGIRIPTHVLGFADDLVTPPHLCAEVAHSIPGATYQVIPRTGHYGYLEDPAAVNKEIVEFFRRP